MTTLALADPAFRERLTSAISRLKRLFDRAHRQGPSTRLQDEYDVLRFWFFLNERLVRQLLIKPEMPENGRSIRSLEGRSADLLFRLVDSPELEVDMGRDPSRWRPDLANLLDELAGRPGKTRKCRTSTRKPSPIAAVSGTAGLPAHLA